MNARLHRKTPTVNAIDSRGLPVRHVAYHRCQMDEPAQARITQRDHDLAGRQVAQRDPRLFATATDANLVTVYSLSGKALLVNSVDAGWRLNLPGDAGQIVHRWEQNEQHWRTTYDNQLRPTAVLERAAGQAPRRVECLRYGDSSPEAATRNLCGALIRHDDSAGTLLIDEHALCGKPLSQTRRLLADITPPDWPADEKDRDSLLEEGKGHRTSWCYDALAQPIQQSDATQHQQRYAFDVAGQLMSVSLKINNTAIEKTIAKDFVYNALGQVESQTLGNGVISRAVFDPANGRLTSLCASVSGRTLQDLHYSYDAVGNVTRIEDKVQPARFGHNQRVEAISTFAYDSLYQLIRATGREAAGLSVAALSKTPVDPGQLFNFTEHYEYDAGGNLTKLRHAREGNHYTRTLNIAATSNRLLSWRTGHSMPATAMDFDANGNQQSLDLGRVLQWNSRNQLDSVLLVQREDRLPDIERYGYDSSGLRVRKIQTTYASSATQTREVRYLPGLEIRTRHGERLEVITLQAGRCNVRYLHWTEGRPSGIAANQMRYSLDDHLGSSSLELDDQAALISQESYLPFGGTAWIASRSAVEADYRTLRYCGKERDASGLYYYGHRYYAPWLQRWISPDPAGAVDGLNLYCMVGNNPLRFVDHQGLVLVDAQGRDIDPFEWTQRDGHERSKKMMLPPPTKRTKQSAQMHGEGFDSNPSFSKTKRKELVVHAYGVIQDRTGDNDMVLNEHYNLPAPRSGPTGYRGVDQDYDGSATSEKFYLNFGSYKISNTPDYIEHLADNYRDRKKDPNHQFQVDPEALKLAPTLSRTIDNLYELQGPTRELIEKHIDACNAIIPIRAGGPGAHGEVGVLNSVVALYPGQAERVLSDTTLFTEKLTGQLTQPEPFIACFNCSGIIPENVRISTGRNPRNYGVYNFHVSEIK
ncbi:MULTISPECIES: RHS repeat-associated core domain-containing protein [Pseudomonas]|uniref:Putative toxin n=1 Tax=Pseudomonas brassicacearum (strain NFM421) TaxID=994484 RepID=F2KBR9_PSEBN|nr:RHS repeat-associated core domain-containing protein [Pseudomonas brassicacearum]AEA66851.1 Putative toxin [Pseudomonas brassicacearum subsp. brassicacearum NFM421]